MKASVPRRLSQLTHDLCKRAMSGEFGKEIAANYCAIVDDPDYDKRDCYTQYNTCLQAIVEQAPIRLTDGELLSGSATLNKAREHEVPAALKSWKDPSKSIFRAKSHLTPHYQKVIKRGIRGLEEEIARLTEILGSEKKVRAIIVEELRRDEPLKADLVSGMFQRSTTAAMAGCRQTERI